MNFLINAISFDIIINYTLYYLNYIVFYTILIVLFKKNIIVVFNTAYKEYIFNKKNNTLILNKDNKHVLLLKKTFKDKNQMILFFKRSIEGYIIMKSKREDIKLENKKVLAMQAYLDEENIKKTLYENNLLAYSKDSFKKHLFAVFMHNNNTSFVSELIKDSHEK